MTQEGSVFSERVDALLGGRSKETIYPCIRDLLEHGLDLCRFLAGERTPDLQEITQYLAAWSRHAGLREEESACWLLDYTTSKVSSLTTRTPAAIRHSTKSNLRFIYRSEVTFRCEGRNNGYRCDCGDCTFYALLPADPRVRLERPVSRSMEHDGPVAYPEPVKKKDAFKEQFRQAQYLIQEEMRTGTSIEGIFDLLQLRGFKTRTGLAFRVPTLRNEMKNLLMDPLPPLDPDGC